MKTKTKENKNEKRYSGKSQLVTVNGVVMTRKEYLEYLKERS